MAVNASSTRDRLGPSPPVHAAASGARQVRVADRLRSGHELAEALGRRALEGVLQVEEREPAAARRERMVRGAQGQAPAGALGVGARRRARGGRARGRARGARPGFPVTPASPISRCTASGSLPGSAASASMCAAPADRRPGRRHRPAARRMRALASSRSRARTACQPGVAEIGQRVDRSPAASLRPARDRGRTATSASRARVATRGPPRQDAAAPQRRRPWRPSYRRRQTVDRGGERPRRRQPFEDAEQRRLAARLGRGERLDDDALGACAGNGQARHRGFAGDRAAVDDVVDEGGDRWRRPAGGGHGEARTGRPRKGISRRSTRMIVHEVR